MTNDNINGFLNIYKPKGITSFDVCRQVKKIFNTKKVGHSGTLDPNATGVMQIALGKATKLLPILEDHTKVYEATVKFGIYTETLDPEGEVIDRKDSSNITVEAIDKALVKLSAITEQIPPIYSAIKVDGKKLYEYAREGKSVELKPRPVKIYEVSRVSDIYHEEECSLVKVRLTVSKGFYVRSFVRDLALELDNIAIMSDLVRVKIADFEINQAIKLDDLKLDDVISIEDTFKSLERLDVKEYLVSLIKNGVTLDERQIVTSNPFKVYYDNKILAIYAPVEKNKYKIVQYLGE